MMRLKLITEILKHLPKIASGWKPGQTQGLHLLLDVPGDIKGAPG